MVTLQRLHLRACIGALVFAACIAAAVPALASWATDGNALGPRLIDEGYSRSVPDGAGGVIATWVETRDCDHANIYAQHLDASGSPLWGLDGIPVCTYSGDQLMPHIVTDMSGGAIIFWQDYRGGSDPQVYAQRLNGSGAALWTPDGNPMTTGAGFHGLLRTYIHAAVSDGSSGAYVVYEIRSSSSVDIYVQHVKDSGSTLLGASGLLVSGGTGHAREPAIATDGAGGALVAWTDSRSGADDIYAQHVTSAGTLLWVGGGAPVCAAVGNQIREQLVSDGAGGAIVAWQDSRTATDPDIYAQHLDASGARVWAPADGIDLSPSTAAQLMPQVVSDAAGGAILAWTQSPPSAGDGIYAQRVSGAGVPLWPGAAGLPVCTVSGQQEIERIVEDGSGGAIIAWNDMRAGTTKDLYAQRVTATGAFAWAPATGLPVVTASDDQHLADVVSDGGGGAIVGWSDLRGGPPGPYDSGAVLYAQHMSGGGAPAWIPDGNIVCAPGALQFHPSIVNDGLGGSFTAWEDYRSGCNGDIFVQHLDATGVAQCGFDGAVVCGATGSQQHPQICSDGAGGAIMAWLDFRNGNADIFAQRVDATGSSLWAVDGVPVCTDSSAVAAPQVVACQSGGAIVVWEDRRGGGNIIYAQKITNTGAIAPGWFLNGMPAVTTVSTQVLPQVTTDGVNGCIIAWQDARAGDQDIYAQRIDESGVRQWAAAGVPVCTAPKDQIGPRIAPDGEKGAIVTWEDDRSGDPDVYARRVDGTGTPVWAVGGLLVYGDANTQSNPRIATDAFGSAIVAWQDDRAGQLDIYAQKIALAGSLLWPAAGVVVCAQPGAQQDPAIAADGSGGALISWRDARSGVDDIYVQRIDPSGAPHCDPSGVALCLATDQQYDNVLAPDGVGGGVVAWTDSRGTHYGDTKVYAMRVPPECGSLTTGVEGERAPAAGDRLLQNQPNPFNPATTIAYETAKSGRVRIAVFDISGRLVRTLLDANQAAGSHQVRWDGTLDSGTHAASGAYFYRITFQDGARSARRMVLLK